MIVVIGTYYPFTNPLNKMLYSGCMKHSPDSGFFSTFLLEAFISLSSFHKGANISFCTLGNLPVIPR